MKHENSIVQRNTDSPLKSWLLWVAGLLVLWWILIEGRWDGMWFVLPVGLLAFALRRALPIPLSLRHIRPLALFVFFPYFLWKSLLGGVDVACRAFHPRLPLQPAWYEYPLRLRSDGARVFLTQVISLMPGTLSCRIGSRNLLVHVLTGSREQVLEEIAELEKRVLCIFREEGETDHA